MSLLHDCLFMSPWNGAYEIQSMIYLGLAMIAVIVKFNQDVECDILIVDVTDQIAPKPSKSR